jgi:N-hydroxyarylamine O-acetyltransferase
MISQQALFEKYLELLGVSKSEPDFDLLKKIVKAHLIKVPFENISKLLYKKQGMNYIPDLSIFLTGIEKYNFGGTCYTNNYYLYCLLKELSFEIKLCGADMKNPDVHLISIVKMEDKEYIVDGGYAAPFLNPLPRDLKEDHVITSGNEKYIIKSKDELGRTTVEQYNEENFQHWYTAKPEERKIDDFRKVIENSYADDAVFMNAVRITRFSENGSLVLRNLQLTELIGLKTLVSEIPLENISEVIQDKFGIPAEKVSEAVIRIKKLKNIFA